LGTKPAPVTEVNIVTGEIFVLPSLASYGSYELKTVIVDKNGAFDVATFKINIVKPGTNLTTLTLPLSLAMGTNMTSDAFPLAGTSSMNLPVTYTAGPATVCFVDSAGQLHIMGVGTCSVKASSGTGKTLSSDTKAFVVNKAPQTVTIVAPGATGKDGVVAPAATDSANGFKLSATMSSGLTPVYTSLDPAVCLVDDDGTVTWLSDLVANPAQNKCRVAVTQPGDKNFYALADSPANVIEITSTHVAVDQPAPTNATSAIGAPRAIGTYSLGGGQWIITVTKTSVSIKPWSSGKFIGPITAAISIPYMVKVKGKLTKKIQTCSVVFGITKKYAVSDPMAWKSKPYANAKPCVLNKDAFAYFMTGKPINATAKVTRDRRWPTTMLAFKGDDGKGKAIPKDYKNWKLNIG
jgi:hypothetical protein